MIKGQLSARDDEILSAYLDGQLNSKERARLEARLNTTPILQATLDDLQKTRLLLRSLPRPRRPRSFTLTPQMVTSRQPQPKPLFPAFSFASAVSSLLLVLVLLGDFLGLAPRAVHYAAPDNAQPVALEAPQPEAAISDAGMAQEAASAEAEGMEITQTEETLAVAGLPPAAESAELATGGAQPSEEPSPKTAPTESLDETAELPVEPSPEPIDIVGISASNPVEPFTTTISATQDVTASRIGSATATPSMTQEATATPTVITASLATSTLTETAEAAALAMILDTPTARPTDTPLPLPPTADTNAQEPQSASENQPTQASGDVTIPSSRSNALLTIEVILGVVAVATGLAAFFLRRGSRA